MNNYPRIVPTANEIDLEREAGSIVEPEVEGRVVYLYDESGFFNGAFTLEGEDDIAPAHSSPFTPPSAMNQVAWFDGRGWRLVQDLESMELEDAKVFLINMCSNIRYIDDLKYSVIERSMWERQYADAIAHLAGNPSQEPLIYLQALVDETGEPIDELATKIVERYKERERDIAALNAKVQRIRNEITQAESVSDFPSYGEILELTT